MTDKRLCIDHPSPSLSCLPHITPSILNDHLTNVGIEIAPGSSQARRLFRWFKYIQPNEKVDTAEKGLSGTQILFICDAKDAQELFDRIPGAFALVMANDTQDIELMRSFSSRTTIVRSIEPTDLVFAVQSLFTKMLLWESALDKISYRQGSIGDLLDVSAKLLGNFMFVSDNNFNLIAYTESVEPPDNLHRTIVKDGCLSAETIAEKRFRLPEKMFYTRGASEITPFDRISRPIHVDHSYIGSISMACNVTPDTPGLRDILKTLSNYISPLCEKNWRKQAQYNCPSYFFLTRLLDHEILSNSYIESQMLIGGLEEEAYYKVIVADIDNDVDPSRAEAAIKAGASLNEGASICFPYRHHVIALLHAKKIDGKLSHLRINPEADEKICVPYGIVCGSSSVFTDIVDIDLAYRQACLALDFRQAIRQEQFDEERRRRNVFLFEDALPYYLISPGQNDERFIRFSFSCSIANALYREDLENGTNNFALVWFYLQNERNATVVAQRMHMHRNTVLYHIEKIQKRFDFDLSSKTARDWMLLCYKYLFLIIGGDPLAAIIDDTNPEEPGKAD